MIEETLTSTGLLDRRHQEIRTLSKGYRQRVGLAQAILHQPSILILDEPTNGLDPLQIQEIRALIKRLAQHTTIFLSTHILSEIEAVCDRVMILIDGELAADHSIDELLNRPELKVRVKGEGPIEDTLMSIEGVESITALEVDDFGFTQYLIRYHDTGTPPYAPTLLTAKIGRLIVESGWDIGELSTHTQSLESAFQDLQYTYAKRTSHRTSTL